VEQIGPKNLPGRQTLPCRSGEAADTKLPHPPVGPPGRRVARSANLTRPKANQKIGPSLPAMFSSLSQLAVIRP
jgi:hypothetical protein